MNFSKVTRGGKFPPTCDSEGSISQMSRQITSADLRFVGVHICKAVHDDKLTVVNQTCVSYFIFINNYKIRGLW
jgi:hypothetical protein